MQGMNPESIEGETDGVSDGSGSCRRSDGWFKHWIMEQQKERRMMQEMDQRAIEGATDGASVGSGSNWWSDEWCKLLTCEQS